MISAPGATARSAVRRRGRTSAKSREASLQRVDFPHVICSHHRGGWQSGSSGRRLSSPHILYPRTGKTRTAKIQKILVAIESRRAADADRGRSLRGENDPAEGQHTPCRNALYSPVTLTPSVTSPAQNSILSAQESTCLRSLTYQSEIRGTSGPKNPQIFFVAGHVQQEAMNSTRRSSTLLPAQVDELPPGTSSAATCGHIRCAGTDYLDGFNARRRSRARSLAVINATNRRKTPQASRKTSKNSRGAAVLSSPAHQLTERSPSPTRARKWGRP